MAKGKLVGSVYMPSNYPTMLHIVNITAYKFSFFYLAIKVYICYVNRYAREWGSGRKPALLLPSDRQLGGTPQKKRGGRALDKKVTMDAQCNAFYGTALSWRECLTTPKSSESDGRHSAFLYRNAVPYVIATPCCPTLL